MSGYPEVISPAILAGSWFSDSYCWCNKNHAPVDRVQDFFHQQYIHGKGQWPPRMLCLFESCRSWNLEWHGMVCLNCIYIQLSKVFILVIKTIHRTSLDIKISKCPIFLGNFTPKTSSNYCLKNRAQTAFQVDTTWCCDLGCFFDFGNQPLGVLDFPKRVVGGEIHQVTNSRFWFP